MAGVEGRVALVTGAGSAQGIGFATARLLRAKGAKVAITSTTDRIFERLKELGGGPDQTFAKTADLTDSAMVTALTGAIEDALGPVDIVVNNAGMVQVGRDESGTNKQMARKGELKAAIYRYKGLTGNYALNRTPSDA